MINCRCAGSLSVNSELKATLLPSLSLMSNCPASCIVCWSGRGSSTFFVSWVPLVDIVAIVTQSVVGWIYGSGVERECLHVYSGEREERGGGVRRQALPSCISAANRAMYSRSSSPVDSSCDQYVLVSQGSSRLVLAELESNSEELQSNRTDITSDDRPMHVTPERSSVG